MRLPYISASRIRICIKIIVLGWPRPHVFVVLGEKQVVHEPRLRPEAHARQGTLQAQARGGDPPR